MKPQSDLTNRYSSLKDKAVKTRLKNIIEKLAEAKSLDEISNIIPIVSYPGYYRIKFGDYRIGISLEDNTVWLLYFGKRDYSTYKRFP